MPTIHAVHPPNHIETLTHEEAMDLLTFGAYLGRIAYIEKGRPVVRPVNYLADDGEIIFRTHKGTAISRFQNEHVEFETDSSHPLEHSGWSVIVQGVASVIRNSKAREILRRGPLMSWAWPQGEHYVSMSILEISGIRIVSSEEYPRPHLV